MPVLRRFLKSLLRRQSWQSSPTETQLKRCLSTLDITFLGIGSTLGLGIYVIAGQVASTKAGPAVIISFAIAAIASVFAGLCYAEFGARVPKAGSAYVYSYVTVGELMAFIIGWNLILEYVIGVASVARGYSGYIDALAGQKIEKALATAVPMNLPTISHYPDFLAFGIILLLTVTLCFGVQFSSKFNSVFTVINLAIVIFSVVGGAIKSDVKNWYIPEEEASRHDKGGAGGFMPHGISGVMKGASTCFYAFIGFDVIATTGEETKNPQRSIPIGIILSLLVVFLAYFSVSTVETLMMPYYLQNNAAPLAIVFEEVGWPAAKTAVSVGALAGLSTSLLCSMFPLPRILYAMASDGLIFRFFSSVNRRFQTPVIATILSGLLAGAMAMMFNVTELADMMSIGTFLAYSLVAVSVVILRYRAVDGARSPSYSTFPQNKLNSYSEVNLISEKNSSIASNGSPSIENHNPVNSETTFQDVFLQLFNRRKLSQPNKLSTKISVYLVMLISVLIVVFDAFLVFTEDALTERELWAVVPTSVIGFLCLFCMFVLWLQPSSPSKLAFKVPFVPFLPFFSVTANIYLMLQLSDLTWIRFAVWMAIGFSIYFLYGIRNSNLRHSSTMPLVQAPTISLQVQMETQNGGAYVNECHELDSENLKTDLTIPKNTTSD